MDTSYMMEVRKNALTGQGTSLRPKPIDNISNGPANYRGGAPIGLANGTGKSALPGGSFSNVPQPGYSWNGPVNQPINTMPVNSMPVNSFPVNSLPVGSYPVNPISYDPTNMWDAMRQSQIAALTGAYNTNLMELGAQETKIPGQYDPLRAQAEVNAERQRNAIAEMMANGGQSSAGGTSLTLQQRNMNNRNNEIGSYNRAQQQALSDIGLQKSKLGAQYQSDIAQANANIDFEQAKAKDAKDQAELDRVMSLFLSGRISDGQFEKKYKELTGKTINARDARRGGSGGGSRRSIWDDPLFAPKPTPDLKDQGYGSSTSDSGQISKPTYY